MQIVLVSVASISQKFWCKKYKLGIYKQAKKVYTGWGCHYVVEHLSSMHVAIGSSPTIRNKKT